VLHLGRGDADAAPGGLGSRTLAQLGDREIDPAGACLPGPIAIAIAMIDPVRLRPPWVAPVRASTFASSADRRQMPTVRARGIGTLLDQLE
jgi:hypothetical protein